MRYEFRIDGVLSDESRDVFPDMRVVELPPQTLIEGEVIDESHLHGILAQLVALGVTVVSVLPEPVGLTRRLPLAHGDHPARRRDRRAIKPGDERSASGASRMPRARPRSAADHPAELEQHEQLYRSNGQPGPMA